MSKITVKLALCYNGSRKDMGCITQVRNKIFTNDNCFYGAFYCHKSMLIKLVRADGITPCPYRNLENNLTSYRNIIRLLKKHFGCNFSIKIMFFDMYQINDKRNSWLMDPV